ncbi:hypothetical protein Tco_0403408, partial [Tanacetum coccineum]
YDDNYGIRMASLDDDDLGFLILSFGAKRLGINNGYKPWNWLLVTWN